MDGTFSKAKGGGDGIGCTKVGKGVQIMILVDAKGLPLAVSTASASPHKSGLIQQLFGFMLRSQPPERIVGDKAYDGDKLDAELAQQGIEVIAPQRSTVRRLRMAARRAATSADGPWSEPSHGPQTTDASASVGKNLCSHFKVSIISAALSFSSKGFWERF